MLITAGGVNSFRMEKTSPWWRSFVGKRRKAAKESAAKLEQDLRNQTSAGSPQHPSAEHDQQLGMDGDNCISNDDTYDDSAIQPTFNESSNLRALSVSRSGRFKEKRRTRASLPQNREEATPAAGRPTDIHTKR